MGKWVALARVAAGADGSSGPLAEWLPALLASRSWAARAQRIVVQIAREDPDDPPVCDAAIEVWSDAPLSAELRRDRELGTMLDLEWFDSDEVVALAAPGSCVQGITRGFSQLSFIAARPELTPAEALRHWDEHIPLALEIHHGMNRYVQDRFLPAEGTAQEWLGMAHLHFPDEESLCNGLFRTAADIAVIQADVAEFVGHYATVLAVEHVVKA